MWIRRFSPLLFAFVLIGAGEAPSEHSHYNEVYDESGAPRPAYKPIIRTYGKLSPKKKVKILQKTKEDFKGDNMLSPIPRVLTEDEFKELKRGTEQRALAIHAFLRDYYSGGTSYSQVIQKEVLERIIARSSELGYMGKINPETISFPYGPDIIRDAQGSWRVVEDNPGWIGGVGDLKKALKSLFKRVPKYKSKVDLASKPKEYYEEVFKRYQAHAIPKGGKVVLYSVPPYPDNEDYRISKIFKDLGAEIVTPVDKDRKLVITGKGAFLDSVKESGKIKREPVGYVILNAEHAFADFNYPPAYERAVVEEAKSLLEEDDLNQRSRKALEAALKKDPETGRVDLKKAKAAIDRANIYYVDGIDATRKLQANGLTEALATGKVRSNFTPGTEFIGDKEFYIYVEDLIRHYLHEEPILKNIESERFLIWKNGKWVFNDELLERVMRDQNSYVLKAVDGRGGNAVWVGAKISPEEYQSVKAKILAEPERFKAQKFTHLSMVGDNIVDIRMISHVDSRGVLVSPVPWGRGLPRDGNGKVNLSDQGREFTVMVVKDRKFKKKDCSTKFAEIK